MGGGNAGGTCTSISQMVHVVSMLDVPKRLGSVSFQSKDVSGAQNSLFLFCTCHKQRVIKTVTSKNHAVSPLIVHKI